MEPCACCGTMSQTRRYPHADSRNPAAQRALLTRFAFTDTEVVCAPCLIAMDTSGGVVGPESYRCGRPRQWSH